MAQTVKSPPAVQETVLQSQGQEYSLEKGMAILPWRIPWREEPARLQSIGLQESGMTWRLNQYHHIGLLVPYSAQRMEYGVPPVALI